MDMVHGLGHVMLDRLVLCTKEHYMYILTLDWLDRAQMSNSRMYMLNPTPTHQDLRGEGEL